jgi:hypothetical protein
MRHACDLDLMDLIRLVMFYLKEKETSAGSKQSCNVENRHFYKKLYFNPGLFDES